MGLCLAFASTSATLPFLRDPYVNNHTILFLATVPFHIYIRKEKSTTISEWKALKKELVQAIRENGEIIVTEKKKKEKEAEQVEEEEEEKKERTKLEVLFDKPVYVSRRVFLSSLESVSLNKKQTKKIYNIYNFHFFIFLFIYLFIYLIYVFFFFFIIRDTERSS